MKRLKNIYAIVNEYGDICSSDIAPFLFGKFVDAAVRKDTMEKLNHREYSIKKVFIEEMKEKIDERQ